MALSTYVGSLTVPASTGNQSYTNPGFQPKLVILFGNLRTTDGSDGSNWIMCYGAAVSSSSRFAISANNVGTSVHRHTNTKCVTADNGSVQFEADFVSMDANGFTLNWTTANATAYVVNYIALGGTDLASVAIVQGTSKTSTGTQAYTGAGFQPDSAIFASIGNSTAPPTSTTSHNELGIGFAKSTSQRGYTTTSSNSGGSGYQRQISTAAIGVINDTTVLFEADLSSFDSDGFTLNFGTSDGTARYFWAILLKGPQASVATLTNPASTGNQSYTGTGFTPSLLVTQSAEMTSTSSTVNADESFMHGAAVSSSLRGVVHTALDNGARLTHALDRTKVVSIRDGTSLLVDADLVSMDANGFTLNWTTASATAFEMLYLAIGPAPVVLLDWLRPSTEDIPAEDPEDFLDTPNLLSPAMITLPLTGAWVSTDVEPHKDLALEDDATEEFILFSPAIITLPTTFPMLTTLTHPDTDLVLIDTENDEGTLFSSGMITLPLTVVEALADVEPHKDLALEDDATEEFILFAPDVITLPVTFPELLSLVGDDGVTTDDVEEDSATSLITEAPQDVLDTQESQDSNVEFLDDDDAEPFAPDMITLPVTVVEALADVGPDSDLVFDDTDNDESIPFSSDMITLPLTGAEAFADVEPHKDLALEDDPTEESILFSPAIITLPVTVIEAYAPPEDSADEGDVYEEAQYASVPDIILDVLALPDEAGPEDDLPLPDTEAADLIVPLSNAVLDVLAVPDEEPSAEESLVAENESADGLFFTAGVSPALLLLIEEAFPPEDLLDTFTVGDTGMPLPNQGMLARLVIQASPAADMVITAKQSASMAILPKHSAALTIDPKQSVAMSILPKHRIIMTIEVVPVEFPPYQTLRARVVLLDLNNTPVTTASGTLYYRKANRATGSTGFAHQGSGVYDAYVTTDDVTEMWGVRATFTIGGDSATSVRTFEVQADPSVAI